MLFLYENRRLEYYAKYTGDFPWLLPYIKLQLNAYNCENYTKNIDK